MTDATINVEGTIIGRRAGEFEGKPFGVIQLQARDKEAVKLIEINLADGFDINRYQTGTKTKVPVSVGASKDGRRIYYREVSGPADAASAGSRSASEAVRRPSI
jgi:hypothetical protein